MICSNDPICADHPQGHHSGDRATHGAACHGCLPPGLHLFAIGFVSWPGIRSKHRRNFWFRSDSPVPKVVKIDKIHL